MSRTAGPRGPYQTGIRRRREIIDSATRVFAQYGYAGGSLRQIAEDVGVTPAALSRHFESKEGLLLAVLEDWESQDREQFAARHDGLDYFVHLPELIRGHTKHRGLIELFLTLSTEASNPQHPAREFITRRYTRAVARGVGYLQQAREHGEILPMSDTELEDEVRVLFGLMDGLQLQWLIDPGVDPVGLFTKSLRATLARWTGAPQAPE